MDMEKKWNKSTIAGWQFVLWPSLLIMLFSFYPMIQSLFLSFQSGKGTVYSFVGIKNYVRLFSDPMFLQAVSNTLLYLVVQVPIMLFMGLIIAYFLNMPGLRFKGFYRTAIFLPCVTSLVSYAVLFKSIFSVDGILNRILMSTHLVSDPVGWLTDPIWARIVIIVAITWRWTGYNMIFYLSAMQNIDPSVYEAASIDGASKTRQFFSITTPIGKAGAK